MLKQSECSAVGTFLLLLYCYTAAASFRPKNIKGMESFVVAPTVVIFHLSFSYFLSDVVSFNLT